ncbi:hypothetical protein [Streptomyces sp. NPDC055036]
MTADNLVSRPPGGRRGQLRTAANAATTLHDAVVTEPTQALADAGLTESDTGRGPNSEVSVHLTPANAERLGELLAVTVALLPIHLKDIGVRALGGSSASHITTIHLTDEDGRRLTKLLRQSSR